MAEEANKQPAPASSPGNATPAPSSPGPGGPVPSPMTGMPAGNAMPPGAASPAPGAPGTPGTPGMMLPPHVAAMMPRPYPNPQQMFQPVGLAYVMRMQQMQQGPAVPQPNKNQKS